MSTEPNADHDSPDLPGVAIARMRREARLTGQQLGQMVRMSQAKISRIETGQTTASPGDVGRLARALGASREITDRLVAQATSTHNRMTDWRQTTGSVGGIQSEVAHIEHKTHEFRLFQPNVIVGLAQTSEYARAVISSIDVVYGRREEAGRVVSVAESVSARVRRQEVLAEPTRRFHFLMAESALSSRVAEPVHMLAQIDRLRQLSKQENISLRIIPADADLPFPLIHGFELLDDACVVVDTFNTVMMSRGHDDIVAFRKVFDTLEGVAAAEVAPLLERYRRQYRDLVN
ncbi:helix-turn-helix transcriptional regulator [Actinoplanes sp. NPDC051851]|uniref:helix-turn-helix domain-containing protein n=1 Tax=Actinoplanes sp. NPDC051851 TaxID=3154753 RepID=UPI003434B1C1